MADPGLAALTAVSTLIGFGAEMAFWPQDVLLQSSMGTCGSGRPSATFATTLALSSAAATASVEVWAEERGLAAGLSLAALAYAATAVPLLWYHEGHRERHLPTAGSLLAELRRVRGEYAFRSDAMRHALTGLHVESYWTAILPLIFLANAGSPAVVGLRRGGGLGALPRPAVGPRCRLRRRPGKDLTVLPSLVARAAMAVQPFVVAYPVAFSLLDAVNRVAWGPVGVVSAAQCSESMRRLGGAPYVTLLYLAARTLALPFYAVLALLLASGLGIESSLVAVSFLGPGIVDFLTTKTLQ